MANQPFEVLAHLIYGLFHSLAFFSTGARRSEPIMAIAGNPAPWCNGFMRSWRGWRRATLLIVLATVVAIGGCGDDATDGTDDGDGAGGDSEPVAEQEFPDPGLTR